ncbi:Phosphotyrosyl phosphatase activator [Hortaea werneckii]|nr:Phosphotyrosyl phosphatase activator [Hortaea werneckii]
MAPVLERVALDEQHDFTTPSKKINDGDDLNFFLSSTAYRDLTIWLLQLNRSMFPTKHQTGNIQKHELTSPPTFSPAVMQLRSMLDELSNMIQKAPPHTGPRRFGNVAFRDWCRLAEENASKLLQDRLSTTLNKYAREDETERISMIDELKAYLIGGFGSAQRLDYGTGHELSFLAFLGCLWKLDFFAEGEERSIVIGVVEPYLHLIRNLIMTYTLEPAGSHGVWGLDDHSFLPYIFGSAQQAPAIDAHDGSAPVPTEGSLPSAPSPSIAAKKELVSDWKDSNMYFSAIHFINSVKKGPFWEHSPILYDISGIKDGWGKINKGMLKMYAAEVLGKLPVVQHFPFGSLFRWEHDPQVASQGQSVHAAQQPKSKDVPAPSPSAGASAGTQAPWSNARIGASLPQLQSSTGVPSMRAPSSGTQRPPPPLSATPGRSSTAAAKMPGPPNASNASITHTPTPWASKDSREGR